LRGIDCKILNIRSDVTDWLDIRSWYVGLKEPASLKRDLLKT